MARSAEVAFRAGEDELAGTLLLPDGAGRAPWVLLLPSWLPRDRDGGWDGVAHRAWFADDGPSARPGLLRRLAEALAERGVASFRYDKRGCGRSGGAWQTTTLFALIDDARDALGAMRSRSELDLRRTGIVGHGEGAAVGLSVAIGDPAVGAMTLIGPSARSLRDVLRRGVAQRARTGIDRRHPLVEALDRSMEELIERAERREATMRLSVTGEAIDLALAGWEQAIHTPALALATMLHRSVTLVHGAADAWTDPDESRLLASVLEAAGNAPSLWIEPGAGHDLAELDDAHIAAIAADLVGRLEPRELPPVLLAIQDPTKG
jgi:alpha-beta hydrolase superfamily lysophospholipase